MANPIWTTVHPIPWRNTSFTWLPYWIYDIIVKAKVNGQDWRNYAEDKYKPIFDTLKQAYIDYGDVDFIESRNGYIHKLSDYTPAVTITAKSGAISLKVGDADLAAASLFDIVPSNTTVVLTVDASGNGSIVSNKLHAVKAGDVVVTCTAGSVTATKTVTITV